jgi:hypothetical protein
MKPNLKLIAWTNLLDAETNQSFKVELYADSLDILTWLGRKAIRSKAKKSRALSDAILVRARTSQTRSTAGSKRCSQQHCQGDSDTLLSQPTSIT